MPVTTRSYPIANPNPVNILNTLEQALSDVGFHSATQFGYLQTIANTPGSVVRTAPNVRYLVPGASTTGTGSGAMFDVLRNGQGGISAVTLVTGGANYLCFGSTVTSAAGAVIQVPDTTKMRVGQVVSRIAGTGTVVPNTTIQSIDSGVQITLSHAPSVAINNTTTLLFQDMVTISAASIGGSTYVHNDVTGTVGQSTLTVADVGNVQVGQRVTGAGFNPLTTVTAVSGQGGAANVTISTPLTASITGANAITFSDEIAVTVATVAYQQGIAGTITGTTITGVVSSANIPVGSRVTITSGSGFIASSGIVIVSAITGAGPFTLTLTNESGDFKGFTGTGAIVFTVDDGGATKWFDYDNRTTPNTVTWGVARTVNDGAKKLGTTFWNFVVQEQASVHFPQGGGQPFLYIRAGAGFNPNADLMQGVSALDWFGTANGNQVATYNNVIQICSSAYAQNLVLKTFQSALDPNFVLFCFMEGNTCRSPFFLSKYANATMPWSLDDVFLGGSFEVFQNTAFNTNDVGLNFRIRMSGIPKRQAEAGYSDYAMIAAAAYTNTFYRTQSGNRSLVTPVNAHDDVSVYSRQPNDIQSNMTLPSTVLKTIPICPFFFPVPYYLPDDFVLAEVPYKNAVIGDPLVVTAGVEVYTAVQSANSPVTGTSLVLGARTT